MNVVSFLTSQHRDVEDLLAYIPIHSGEQRRTAFGRLVRLLAVHETAEEEVVHPMAKGTTGGWDVVGKLREEEGEAKDVLFRLENMDVDAAEFDSEFGGFASSVRDHAAREEREEFPLLQAGHSAAVGDRLERLVRIAEQVAPTHPHPHGSEGSLGNLTLGPFLAIADRVRDALTASD